MFCQTPENDSAPLISAETLALKTLGSAHVVVLSASAAFELTNALGREFSVFNGAVRTYRANFDPESDEPSMHPLALAESIRNWAEDGQEGFVCFLVRQALRESVARRQTMEQELPSFVTIQSIARQRARKKAEEIKSDADLLKLALQGKRVAAKRFPGRKEDMRRTSQHRG